MATAAMGSHLVDLVDGAGVDLDGFGEGGESRFMDLASTSGPGHDLLSNHADYRFEKLPSNPYCQFSPEPATPTKTAGGGILFGKFDMIVFTNDRMARQRPIFLGRLQYLWTWYAVSTGWGLRARVGGIAAEIVAGWERALYVRETGASTWNAIKRQGCGILFKPGDPVKGDRVTGE